MMNDVLPLLAILFIACALFGWYSFTRPVEGFEAVEGDRCGVDMAPCPKGTRCINGYCMPPTAPQLPAYSDLKVEPSDPGNLGGFLHTE